ncbi:hypothetical protein SAMN04487846_3404 [Microbacterium sp. cf046]|nr:hypothetical protein SAMN04487846_3404 [Microbacterium sp. cf046]
MRYHSIRNVDMITHVRGDDVTLTAPSHTTATIWGATGTWPLQLHSPSPTHPPDGSRPRHRDFVVT